LAGQVNSATIKTRAEILRGLGKQKRQAFDHQFLNRELPVLVEDRRDKRTGAWRGLSRNYISVLAMNQGHSEERHDWINQEFRMVMTEVTPGGLVGRVLEKNHG
jgi:tRNA A37 methylthiotransferase MiaB